MKRLDQNEIRLAYRALMHRGKMKFDSMTAEQCYACNNFIAGKSALEKHLETCSFMRGIVYKFENQHITTFEDNFRFMGEQPFSVYFDLETTCGKKNFTMLRNQRQKCIQFPIVLSLHLILLLTWIKQLF